MQVIKSKIFQGVSRQSLFVFVFLASVSSVGHRAALNSVSCELGHCEFSAAWCPGTQAVNQAGQEPGA